MKTKLLKPFWLAALLLLSVITASAYDFMVNGIAYNYNSDGTSVYVTFTEYSSSNNYSGLTTATIPSSVTYNGNTYSVTSIGDFAFEDCSSLTSVTIPNSVTTIGYMAFYNCSGLTTVTIPNSVTSIGQLAFYNCSGLASVTIGNSVTSIGKEAFYQCSGLTSVTIPNSVTSIGYAAFFHCSSLTSISIGNSVTRIDEYAFCLCSLTSVTIPNSVTFIGNYAFSSCSGLESIVVENGNITYDSRNNCNAIIETASNTLIAGCKNTTIPNSVTAIGDGAFQNCSGLTSVIIPNSVTSIKGNAFYNCSGLTSIYNHINHPTDVTLGSNVFYGVNKTKCTLYVKYDAVNEYSNADQWKDFKNILTLTSSISLNTNYLSMTSGQICSLETTILPENASRVLSWTSSNTDIATVDQNGVVTAHMVGTATITATTTDGTNLSTSCEVTVTGITNLNFDISEKVLYRNDSFTITPIILPENVVNKTLNWQSSNPTIAAVNQNGKVTANAVGTAIITATTTDGSNLSDSCLVEVRAYASSLTFNKTQLNMYVGSNDSIIATVQPANAYNKTLLWQSSDTTVATVDQNGKVTAVALGQAVITATTTDGTNLSASCQVNVTGITSIALNKTSTLLYLEETDNLTATITPADVIINTIAWTSSNPSVASVNQNGKVTAHAVGTAIITATTTDGTNLSASCAVEVRAYVSSVTFDKTQIDTYVGATETITATVLPENAYNKGLTWQTSNLSVASVDQNGKVTAHALGAALIVAKTTDGTNLIATCEVNVMGITSLTLNVTDITLFAGSSQTLQATIVPGDVVVSTLLWQSSDPTVATVDQNGKVTALAAGTATITATTTDGTQLTASCTVTVWPQYALVAPGIEHTRGEQPLTVEYVIEMLNKNSISGMQFEIQLPEGVSLMNSSYGLPDMWLGDRARDHFIDVTELGYNHYQVLISSPTNKNFRNNSGDLVFMHLLVDQYHAAGIYYIDVTNIIFTEADETEHAVADASYPVQYNYMLGDADADMRVIVADYITTALFITNRPTIRFYEDAANVHSANSAINVTDLTGIINIVLGIRPTEILHAPALGNASPAGSMEPEMNVGVKRLDADRWMMSLDLSNGQPMAAFQLDLKLPDGVTYESASVTDRTALLNVLDGTLPDGTVRLVVSAPSIDDIKAGNGEVLNITLKGNPTAGGMALFDNITLAERSLNSYELEPMTVPFTPTAIDDVVTYNEVRIYPENGCIVIESPYAGTAQLVLLNGISSPLDVKAGRNVYPVGKNEYYIVRFGSTTAKLKF